MSSTAASPRESGASTRLYRAVWRWHFYAGLLIVPFLCILALSGLVILFVTGVAPEYGDWLKVNPLGTPLGVTEQIEKAVALHPGGKAGQYIAPWGPEYPALVRVDLDQGNRMLAVNPYTGDILRDIPQAGTWNEFMTDVHGTLLIGGDGGPGDVVMEVAASLGVIMVVTGLYLWWPRNGRGLGRALVPDTSLKGRPLWKSLHESLGAWMSVVLLFFLLSGLAWAGVWGGKFVQAWSTFPAEKWDSVPLSNKTHADMNHGAAKEVPWTLEQTPIPQSGSDTGITGLAEGTPPTFDALVALGRAIGFSGRFQVAAPGDETGVWTLSQDSMSYDSTNPTADRTVHVDRYTGKILADVAFADYPPFGKAMAIGIALHEGQLGWWNVALNAAFCLSVLFACVSGVVMWWKRRPAGELAVPRYPKAFRPGFRVAILGIALAAAFPLGGLAIAAFALIDILLPRRLKEAGISQF